MVSLLPFIVKDLHLNLTIVGFLGASQGALGTLLAIPTGILASKIGGIKLIFISLIVYSISALGISISPHVALLFLFFYLAAAGFAPFHIVGQSLTARFSEKGKLGRNMGSFTAIGEMGRIAIPAAALYIATPIGWRLTYGSLATTGIILFLCVIYYLRTNKHIYHYKNGAIKQENSKDWMKQLLFMLREKKLTLVLLTSTIDNLGSNAVYIFIPFLLLAKGIPTTNLAFFMGAFFVGTFIGKSFLGRSVDTYGPAKVFIFAEYCMALLLILLTFANFYVFLILLVFILGLFTRGTTPVMAALTSHISHEAHYEKAYTLTEFFGGISAILSSILLGVVADRFGITYSFYLSASFAVAATIPIFFYLQSTHSEESN